MPASHCARGCTEAGVRKASKEETAGGVCAGGSVGLWGVKARSAVILVGVRAVGPVPVVLKDLGFGGRGRGCGCHRQSVAVAVGISSASDSRAMGAVTKRVLLM